jgi:hypothetical protein
MQEFISTHQWIIWLVIVWTIPWKGVALWKSARNGHKTWFVLLLLLNTLAILDIVYILSFSRKENNDSEIKNNFSGYTENSNGENGKIIRGL